VKTIIGYLGSIIFVAGITLLIPAGVAFFYSETPEALHFILLAVVTVTVGLLVRIRYGMGEATLLEAMVISPLAWLIVSLIGAVPYVLLAGMSWIDAYFEAMSGFTTTGMTLISDVEHLSHSLLFWRAFTQWVGGVGIILLFILFIPHSGLGVGVWRLYRAEAREERLTARISDTVKQIWAIYLVYTLACSFLLWLVGFNYFEAITHAFTTLSTGGFSTRNGSIGEFQNPYAEAIIIVFMVLGGTNFLVHIRTFTRRTKALFKNIEVRTILLLILVFSLLVTCELMLHSSQNFIDAFRLSIFQVVSILTTTGYTTTNIMNFSPLSKAVLMFLMLIGGCVGSTGGAIKVMRMIILVKVVHHVLLKVILPPGTIRPLKIGGNVVEEEEVVRILGFFVAYLLLLAFSGFLLTFFGFEPFNAFSAVFSAQGNVGPCFLPINNNLPAIVKGVLIFDMWAGRLEIIPILVLFTPKTWKEFARLGKRKPE